MKVSEQWLRDWVDPPVDTATLVEQLTAAGLEVDSAEPLASLADDIVVAEVLEVAHPLRVLLLRPRGHLLRNGPLVSSPRRIENSSARRRPVARDGLPPRQRLPRLGNVAELRQAPLNRRLPRLKHLQPHFAPTRAIRLEQLSLLPQRVQASLGAGTGREVRCVVHVARVDRR